MSVATLVRVLVENPRDGNLMLALERKATLLEAESGRVIEVKTQPFGGAMRIRDLSALQDIIGDFHFDSEEARSEQDFRIFIRPSSWEAVQEFCLQNFSHADTDTAVFESDPGRELAEEFANALGTGLKSEQYICKPVATIVEEGPSPTENIHARGHLTARVYRLFEARILDPALAHAMLTNSEHYSDQDLHELGVRDAQSGGKGRANAMLTRPLKLISDVYSAMPLEARNTPISFENHQLDETVCAILEGISVPKYRRF